MCFFVHLRFGYLLQSIKQRAYSISFEEGKRWKQKEIRRELTKWTEYEEEGEEEGDDDEERRTSPMDENRTTSEKSRLFYWHFRRRAKKMYTWKEVNMTQTMANVKQKEKSVEWTKTKSLQQQKWDKRDKEWPGKVKSRIIVKITKW